MHFLQAINSDISVLIVCNKNGGTINGDIKKCVKILTTSQRGSRDFNLLSTKLCDFCVTPCTLKLPDVR